MVIAHNMLCQCCINGYIGHNMLISNLEAVICRNEKLQVVTRYFQTAPDQIIDVFIRFWLITGSRFNGGDDDDDNADDDNADDENADDDNADDDDDDDDVSYFCGGMLLVSSETLLANPSFSDCSHHYHSMVWIMIMIIVMIMFLW